MPWTKNVYPNAMKNLPEVVRNKAIEISNLLLQEGKVREGTAIATGISRAKKWAQTAPSKKSATIPTKINEAFLDPHLGGSPPSVEDEGSEGIASAH
jgi:uncharacterized protein YdaT